MADNPRIIGLTRWLQSPAGRYLLEWEQQHLDSAVADLFGFHAVQLGLPELDALRANRMPHRWVAEQAGAPAAADEAALPRAALALRVDYDALPFDSASLDLVVLPHTLELAHDPHQTLREVERVLVPEGRVVIVGFNPASLWGLRQRFGRIRRGLGLARRQGLFLPDAGEFLAYRRLRDWLRLLSFEVEAGRFGCYRLPVASERWLQRSAWMDHSGERWWPVFGAAYFVTAVKRVRGMRLVGLAREPVRRVKAGAVIATQKQRRTEEEPA
ncbi:MAG: methyltransferase domain-containing protein [Piscinibacter sp.]|uniref:class I SAM-dependent methyltransferase n=1 Tax=Piscinibacter sp. TaxID=1903157 RepID=UPI00258DCB02|nr:methyltransferase domain-containing protein [Piscinibacter sp.]MCW5663592.1 methyltransferase domain-containing protein [Piscinibacter sp.]